MDSEKNLGEGEQEINLLPREKVEKIEQFEKRSSSIIQQKEDWFLEASLLLRVR